MDFSSIIETLEGFEEEYDLEYWGISLEPLYALFDMLASLFSLLQSVFGNLFSSED